MSKYNQFKKELKRLKENLDIKTLIRKEKVWNELYEDKSNIIRYEILYHSFPLTSIGDEVIEIINKYGYKIVSKNLITQALKKR